MTLSVNELRANLDVSNLNAIRTANNTIWLAGRIASSRGEAFRVRIGLAILKSKAGWRVQTIAADPPHHFTWDD